MSQEDQDETGAMIFVMGLTGAGKSYFINRLKKGAVIEGAGIYSETSTCQMIKMTIGSTPLAIVDTPGFDDSFRSDEEIFHEIAQFLSYQFAMGIPLKGIIYMHRITDNRMHGSALRALHMFQALCGKNALDHVILATTMWSNLPSRREGYERVQQLREGPWFEMEECGSVLVPYDGTRDNAMALITDLLDRDDVVLQIQHELVVNEMSYDQTAAASHLVTDLENLIDEKDAEIAKLQEALEVAENRKDGWKRHRALEKQQKFEAEKQEDRKRRTLLKRKPCQNMDRSALQGARQEGWSEKTRTFASILSVSVSVVTNLILPIMGVSLCP